MRRLVLPVAAASAGCAQLFGIQNTSAPPIPPTASLTVTRISLGVSTVQAPQDVTGYNATFEVPDTADPSGLRAVAAGQTATDTWSLPIKDTNPPVLFTLPDYPTPLDRLYAFDSRDVTVGYPWFEHPGAVAPPMNATVNVKTTLPSAFVAGQSLEVFTVGSWSALTLSGTQLPAINATAVDATYTYSTASSLSGTPLTAISQADELMLLRYTGADLTAVMEAAPFDMTATNTITGSMPAVTHDQTLMVNVAPGTVDARFALGKPAVTGTTMSWSVNASPGSPYASLGPQLQAGSLTAMDTGALNVSYGNPFTASHAWPTTFTFSGYAHRTYTPPAMPAVTVYAGLTSLVAPTAGQNVGLDAPLPTTTRIDGMPLDTDGMTITRDNTQAIAMSFDVETSTAPVAYYSMLLYELVPNAGNTALVYDIKFGAAGASPSFLVPPSYLQPGHLYVIRSGVQSGGAPNVSTGNLVTRSLPVSTSYFDSAVFSVSP